MAVVGELRVASGAQADHEALDAVVSAAVDRAGGPPAGLMAPCGPTGWCGIRDHGSVVLRVRDAAVP